MSEFAPSLQYNDVDPATKTLQRIEGIQNHVNEVLKEVDSHQEDWGDGTVLKVKEKNITSKDGTTVFWTQATDPNDVGNSFTRFSVHGLGVYADISVFGDDTYMFRTSENDDPEDPVVLLEALQDPGFGKALGILCAYAEQSLPEVVPVKEEVLLPIPTLFNVKKLDQEQRNTFTVNKEKLGLTPNMTNKFLPKIQLTSEIGHTWLMSNVFMLGDHEAVVLYVPTEKEDTATPYVVYASGTHATWRYLPRIEENENGNVWFKKPLLEEAVNVPIALQKILWQSQGEYWPSMLTQHEEDQVAALTHHTFDARRAATTADYIDLEIENDPTNAPVPRAKDQQPDFSFSSQLYGLVKAYEVPSLNGKYTYLLLEETAGNVWASVIQKNAAQMTETFTLKPFVVDHDSYQQPLEHAQNRRYQVTDLDVIYVSNTPQQTPTLLAGWR